MLTSYQYRKRKFVILLILLNLLSFFFNDLLQFLAAGWYVSCCFNNTQAVRVRLFVRTIDCAYFSQLSLLLIQCRLIVNSIHFGRLLIVNWILTRNLLLNLGIFLYLAVKHTWRNFGCSIQCNCFGWLWSSL